MAFAPLNPNNIRIVRKKHDSKPYYATIKGSGAFGTGLSRDEAKACLLRRIAEFNAERGLPADTIHVSER